MFSSIIDTCRDFFSPYEYYLSLFKTDVPRFVIRVLIVLLICTLLFYLFSNFYMNMYVELLAITLISYVLHRFFKFENKMSSNLSLIIIPIIGLGLFAASVLISQLYYLTVVMSFLAVPLILKDFEDYFNQYDGDNSFIRIAFALYLTVYNFILILIFKAFNVRTSNRYVRYLDSPSFSKGGNQYD